MSKAIIMIYINITGFVLINELEKGHSVIEKRRLKNNVIFFSKTLWLFSQVWSTRYSKAN